MSNRQYLNSPGPQDDDNHQPRPGSKTPPIEWPVSDNKSNDNDRAAEYARRQVEQAYVANTGGREQRAGKVESTARANDTTRHVMREEPYDWQKYHTAWQQYYHQYFYRYYADWWHQQKQQLEAEQPDTKANQSTTEQKVAKELRDKVRSNVEQQAKKIKASSHFKPLMAAFSVAVLFLFINYNQVIVGAIKQYVAPGSTVTTPVIVEPSTAANVGPEPKLIIPKIGVDTFVVYDEPKVDEASYQKALERGAVRLGTTANPGTKGNVVIGGHSSNNVFNAGKFKYIFVNLRRVEINDIIYLHYNGQRYTYKVTVANKIITPKDTSVLKQTEVPMVTIFTCDPPGANVNRLIVQAIQIDPNPNTATANQNQATQVNAANPLPSVAPSIWDRIRSIF